MGQQLLNINLFSNLAVAANS